MKKTVFIVLLTSMLLSGCGSSDTSNYDNDSYVGKFITYNSSSECVDEQSVADIISEAETAVSEQSPADTTVTTDSHTRVIHVVDPPRSLPVIVIHFTDPTDTLDGYAFSYTVDDYGCDAEYRIRSVMVDDMNVTSGCNVESIKAVKGKTTTGIITIGYDNVLPNSKITLKGDWTDNDTGLTEYIDFSYEISVAEMSKE